MAVSSQDTLRDGLGVLELMRSPPASVYTEDVRPDYNKGIMHIQNILDELKERKLRTDELCDVRRIRLQQLLQLKQSDQDAEQVYKDYFSRGIFSIFLRNAGSCNLHLFVEIKEYIV